MNGDHHGVKAVQKKLTLTVMEFQIILMTVLMIGDQNGIMVVQMNQILADTVAGMHTVKENMVHNTTMMNLKIYV